MSKVLITCRQMQAVLGDHRSALEAAGLIAVAPELVGQQFTSAQLREHADNLIGIIAGDDELDRAFIEAATELRVIVRWGIGMDSVDHVAAAASDVTVRNTPGVFGEEVADSAFSYILALARRSLEIDRGVRGGAWPKVEGVSLSGSTLGVIGLGSIGQAVSRRGLGFGMRVVGYDPYVESVPGVEITPHLNDVLRTSRFVVITCPLTPATHHLISAGELATMRSDAFIINVGRGPVVDESALVTALSDAQISGAGLDVYEVEPLPLDSPLREMSNVVLGAHNGSNTREVVERASRRAVEILLEELSART